MKHVSVSPKLRKRDIDAASSWTVASVAMLTSRIAADDVVAIAAAAVAVEDAGEDAAASALLGLRRTWALDYLVALADEPVEVAALEDTPLKAIPRLLPSSTSNTFHVPPTAGLDACTAAAAAVVAAAAKFRCHVAIAAAAQRRFCGSRGCSRRELAAAAFAPSKDASFRQRAEFGALCRCFVNMVIWNDRKPGLTACSSRDPCNSPGNPRRH